MTTEGVVLMMAWLTHICFFFIFLAPTLVPAKFTC